MKHVYVCEVEDEHDGRMPVAVMSDLDLALEKMRVEFSGHMEAHPDAAVDWCSNASKTGCWGWYDINRQVGFYVTRIVLDVWYGR